jgi:phage replication-related protein YjqB (UPF0714/DUF867 family)
MRRYHDFAALQKRFSEGDDFTIRMRGGASGILIMAPHGGKIEPGTDTIADAVAGKIHAFYAFCGVRRQGNRTLHITSHRFNEPRAIAAVCRASTVVTIHGCRDRTAVVYLGGRHRRMRQQLGSTLTMAGFAVRENPNLPGLHPANVCNRGQSGMGVQLELSSGLRKHLSAGGHPSGRSISNAALADFVEATRTAIAAVVNPHEPIRLPRRLAR